MHQSKSHPKDLATLLKAVHILSYSNNKAPVGEVCRFIAQSKKLKLRSSVDTMLIREDAMNLIDVQGTGQKAKLTLSARGVHELSHLDFTKHEMVRLRLFSIFCSAVWLFAGCVCEVKESKE